MKQMGNTVNQSELDKKAVPGILASGCARNAIAGWKPFLRLVDDVKRRARASSRGMGSGGFEAKLFKNYVR
mgnify:CR=1 FL=1